ncbi:acyl-CoA dehydrogenase family protein [Novosphingobium colocasiae]
MRPRCGRLGRRSRISRQRRRRPASGTCSCRKNTAKISPGLTTLEYAPLAEEMGRVMGSSEFFNCSAPDTGNMEVLAKYGTPEQQERWLKPLLDGEIRSAFCDDRAGRCLVRRNQYRNEHYP